MIQSSQPGQRTRLAETGMDPRASVWSRLPWRPNRIYTACAHLGRRGSLNVLRFAYLECRGISSCGVT
jgi:hypothetical protein